MKNVADILAVPGVDGTWLGPADLALSMGMPDKSLVDAALDRVVEATVKSGKLAAATHMPPDDAESFAHFYHLGCRALAVNLLSILKLEATSWLRSPRQVVL